MNRYRELIAFPQVIRLGISAFPARLAYGMIGLGIFFKAEQETGSVAAAGFAIGLNSFAGAITAGLRGSVMDRFGQKWPIRILVPLYASLILLLNTMETRQSILITAFILGITAPPINLSVRPLWKDIVPDSYLRTAYAFDTSMMSSTSVIGPVVITALSLSSRPGLGLGTTAALMFMGGIALSLTPVSRNWIPEIKDPGTQHLLKLPAIRLLIAEGIFIGLANGLFETGVPAFTTIEGVAGRTGLIFGVLAMFNIFGSLLAGLISKKTSPLLAFKRTYLFWVLACAPLAFANPDWSLLIISALLGLAGGMQMVFYWEIVEKVRTKGTAASAIGWLWTFEGTATAFGATISGYISEEFSPRYCLALMSICVLIGYVIIQKGQHLLHAANSLPTQEQDEIAISTALDKTN